jgi:membrane-bound serine protease (ClpP class)
MSSNEWFFLLLAAGLLMIGAEIFVPGGILGAMGVASLTASVVIAFMAFEASTAFFITIAIIGLMALSIYLWVKLFPRTSIGKQMTLSADGHAFKSGPEGLDDLVGKEGEAKSDLRPAGFVVIDGRRLDVVTEGTLIAKGERVRVVSVDGNRVVVRKTNQP